MKNNSILRTTLLAGIALLLTSNVNAQGGKTYFGATFGNTTVDTGVTGLTGTANLDESSTGTKIFFGKKMSQNVSIEGFYVDVGEAILTGNTTDKFVSEGILYAFIVDNAKVEDSANGFGFNANLSHNFSKNSSVLARLGIMSWDYTRKISGVGVASTTSSKSGTDVFYGIGYRYGFNKEYSLTVDYDAYKINEEIVSMTSVGVQYNF